MAPISEIGDAMNRTIVASVLTTLAVVLVLFGLAGVAMRAAFADSAPVLATAALWHGHGHGHGHGMARACTRLDDPHVAEHAAELHRWVSDELTLDAAQSSAFAAVTETFGGWATDMRSVCEMPLADAPAHVAAAVRITQATDVALQRFATAFDAFYATLAPEQRGKLDGWFAHRHGTTAS